MSDRPLAIYGAGGFTMQILPILDRARASGRSVAIVDDRSLSPIYDYPVLHPDAVFAGSLYAIAIADCRSRRRVAETMAEADFDVLVAEHALVSKRATLGEGSIICDHAIIEAGVTVGRHFHANLFSYAAHDCVIGDFVTFAPRVSCNGNVHIGDMVTVGTGVLIRQGRSDVPLQIGTGAVLQMGAVVTRDVEPFAIVKAGILH